jgi:hypothetical protein
LVFRSFDAGGDPLGPALQVNEGHGGGIWPPNIARVPAGGFVVAWSSEEHADTEPLVFGAYARILDASGQPLGSDIELLPRRYGEIYLGGLEILPDGTWLLSWTGSDQPFGNYGVFTRRYSSAGVPLEEPRLVSPDTYGSQFSSSMSADSKGDYVVTWQDEGLGNVDIRGRIFRADGSPATDPFPISNFHFEDEIPQVELSDSGTFVTIWRNWLEDGDGWGVFAQPMLRTCEPDAPLLALGDGRFLVCARWKTGFGDHGSAEPIPLTDASGGFWFFSPTNLELIVKLLDGCGSNGHFWIYAAGLTDVEVGLGVIDTWTGQTWALDNPLARPFAPAGDILALSGCGVSAPAAPWVAPQAREIVRPVALPTTSVATDRSAASSPQATASTTGCSADPTHLCLQNGRFRVSATYDTVVGLSGDAHAVPIASESGLFWFFGPDNVELFVKVLDGCVPFGTYWVYSAGLTNVFVRMTVEDTASGEVRIYENAQGATFQPILDGSAFATCP